MRKLLLLGYVLLSFVFLFYLWSESPPFPVPPPDALLSTEPADSESPLRRSYFTNYTRDQVIEHYKAHFDRAIMLRLNYPPEDAQVIIRDQTRSYYLEELVHPLRESLFINGFVAQSEKDDIWINGVHWEQKITIKYVLGSRSWRIIVGVLIVMISYVIIMQYINEIVKVKKSND